MELAHTCSRSILVVAGKDWTCTSLVRKKFTLFREYSTTECVIIRPARLFITPQVPHTYHRVLRVALSLSFIPKDDNQAQIIRSGVDAPNPPVAAEAHEPACGHLAEVAKAWGSLDQELRLCVALQRQDARGLSVAQAGNRSGGRGSYCLSGRRGRRRD